MRLLLPALALIFAFPAAAGTTYRDFRSRRSGMTCRSRVSGHGFRVSVAKRELF
jgi:hypothetical protein